MFPIGDFIIRIKNAAMAKRREVVIPYSRLKEEVAHVLAKEGYLTDVVHDKDKRTLTAQLVYVHKEPLINGLEIVSKPGLRVYRNAKTLRKLNHSIKKAILSTPKGVMMNEEAQKQHTGGEVIALVW